jgi:hypothetical protein
MKVTKPETAISKPITNTLKVMGKINVNLQNIMKIPIIQDI